ncbi:MAG: DUF4406 domain-containing protein [Patescibacteria group bacterium]
MLIGLITGNSKIDQPLFKRYEEKLTACGVAVANPLTVIKQNRKKVGDFERMPEMKITDEGWEWMRDLRIMLDILTFCDAIFLVPGWDMSCHANILISTAHTLGRKLLFFNDLGELDEGIIDGDEEDADTQTVELPPEEYQSIADSLTHKRNPAGKDKEDEEPEAVTAEDLKLNVDRLASDVRYGRVGSWLEKQMNDPFKTPLKPLGGSRKVKKNRK